MEAVAVEGGVARSFLSPRRKRPFTVVRKSYGLEYTEVSELERVDKVGAQWSLVIDERSINRLTQDPSRVEGVNDVVDLQVRSDVQAPAAFVGGGHHVVKRLRSLLLVGNSLEFSSKTQSNRTFKTHSAEFGLGPSNGQ